MTTTTGYVDSYSICWNSPSADSSESMPLGGGDVGLNVWVEDGNILFYMAKGDAFDSYNHLLKLGRVRLRFDPNPFVDVREFAQALRLRDGCIEINAVHDECGKLWLRFWVERARPVIHVSAQSSRPLALDAAYESWRTYDRDLPLDRRQSRFHAFGTSGLPARVVVRSDAAGFAESGVQWYHRNTGRTIFDYEVEQQGLEADKQFLWNPLQDRTFGGLLTGAGLVPNGVRSGRYMSNLYSGWHLESETPSKSQEISVFLHCAQAPSLEEWQEGLQELVNDDSVPLEERWQEHREWWNAFWERSFIAIAPDEPESEAWQVGRNYQLFRFMLGCTSHGPYPTKFNGGFFTFDPQKIPDDYLQNSGEPPDYRKWGGGSYTAQNQRLLYWPLLKSGDFDMMRPQFEFYRRALGNASLRVRRYWGHAGCCFTEQMNQYGLPIGATYGWTGSYVEGRERRAEYEDGVEVVSAVSMLYESQLEFAWMILLAHQYTELDIQRYLPFIEQAVVFYDEHYRARQRKRAQTEYGPDGKLVFYPSNTLEDHRDAENPASVIAGLTRVLRALLDLPATCQSAEKKQRWRTILEHLPPYPLGEREGREYMKPASNWEHRHLHSPEMYPLYPYRLTDQNPQLLEIMQNTWELGLDENARNSVEWWVQGGVHAARLGLTDHCRQWIVRKLSDDGPASIYRFPAFFQSPDHPPDHNHGGVAMIALQEMLLQAKGRELHILPAWPPEWDVDFRLHAPGSTRIEGKVRSARIVALEVAPEHRLADVVVSQPFSLEG